MIQSINDTYDSYQSEISAASTNKTAEMSTDKNSVGNLSYKTDSVDISDQARAEMQQNAVSAAAGAKSSINTDEQSEVNFAAFHDGIQVKAQAEANSSENGTIVSNSASSSSTSSSTSSDTANNLSIYTESQLDKLVVEGKITKAEENTELRKRAAAETQQVKSEETDNAGDTRYNAQAQMVSDTEYLIGTSLNTTV